MLNPLLVKRFVLLVGISWVTLIVIFIISRHYQLQFNVSSSMPQRLWLTHVGDKDVKQGSYVIIKFHDFRMQHSDDFEYVVKQIGGLGGDQVIVRNCNCYADHIPYPNKISFSYIVADNTYPVFESLSGNHFTPLTKKNMIIPKGCYFIHGQHHPSFDSRYKEFGLICESQIYGKAYPIF
jgi:type IV secretory pathway protease TraF